MKISHHFLALAFVRLAAGADTEHPAMPKAQTAAERSQFTEAAGSELPYFASRPATVQNYIDDFVFNKNRKDRVPQAPLCSDIEFLRRVSLDLTGRLPEPEKIRKFVVNKDPKKRDNLVDELMTVTTKGMTVKPSTPRDCPPPL